VVVGGAGLLDRPTVPRAGGWCKDSFLGRRAPGTHLRGAGGGDSFGGGRNGGGEPSGER
jgi:hypothetical protein